MIGPDKKIKLILVYPMTTGRNFDEVLRVIDSLQLTAKHRVATPANWKQGGDVIIAGSVSDDEAKQLFPGYALAQALHPYRATARSACGRLTITGGLAASRSFSGYPAMHGSTQAEDATWNRLGQSNNSIPGNNDSLR